VRLPSFVLTKEGKVQGSQIFHFKSTSDFTIATRAVRCLALTRGSLTLAQRWNLPWFGTWNIWCHSFTRMYKQFVMLSLSKHFKVWVKHAPLSLEEGLGVRT